MVHWGSLPDGTELHVALGDGPGKGTIEPPFPEHVEDGCGGLVPLKNFRTYHLRPTPERQTTLPEILIGHDRPAVAVLLVQLPAPPKGRLPRFDIVQVDGRRVIGGCTFVVRE